MLIAMRVVQGFGGAMMTPVGRLILLRSFPRSGLVSAMNWMTIPAMIGPTVGPIVGGFLTSYVSWRAIFYLNIPIGLLGRMLALWLFENFRAPAPTRFDLGGFVLSPGSGCCCWSSAIENLGRPMIAGRSARCFFPVALAILALYRLARATAPQTPVLDLSLLRIRTFRIGTVTGGVCRMGLDAMPFLLPLLFQVGFGLSPVQSGLLSFSSSARRDVRAHPCSRPLLRVLGFRRLLVGAACVAAAVTASCALLQRRHAVLAHRALRAVLGLRAQHPVSGAQHGQLCRRAVGAAEPQHQRQRGRPAGGARFWRGGRRGVVGGDRRTDKSDGRGFPPRLFSDRADPARRRNRLSAPDAG